MRLPSRVITGIHSPFTFYLSCLTLPCQPHNTSLLSSPTLSSPIPIKLRPLCLPFLISFNPSFLHCSPCASLLLHLPFSLPSSLFPSLTHSLTHSTHALTHSLTPHSPFHPTFHQYIPLAFLTILCQHKHTAFSSFTPPLIHTASHHLHSPHPH